MEVRSQVGVEGSYGYACSSTMMVASSSNTGISSLSFCNSIRNPLLNSLSYKPLQIHGKPSITAVIKWKKDPTLDAVVQRQKKVKFVTRVRDLLVKQPGMCMSLRELGRHRGKLNLTQQKRLVTSLKRFPAVFDIFDEGVSNLYFRLTPEAEDLFLDEQRLRSEMESILVSKIRKLLMMSIDKTLLLYKLAHLKKDLGLPDDFKTNMVEKYPQFFRVVELKGGTALELTSLDPELAVSAWENKMHSELLESGVVPSAARTSPKQKLLSRNYKLSKKDKERIRAFQDMAYVSPYAEFAHIDPASREAEKHACAVIHEVLSLTIEKRLNIDFLTHFRRDYKFSQQLHGMLVRHPELFYVSLKGDRHSVFLREAYNGSELSENEPLLVVKEKLRKLVAQESKQGTDADDDDDYSDEEEVGIDTIETIEECEKEPARNDKGRVLRRPLHVLEIEEKAMAALVSSSVERW